MAKKEANTAGYDELLAALRTNEPRRLYAFYGEERYLLEHYLGELRKLVPAGTEEFNLRRFDGRTLTPRDLSEAVDALPVFSERTVTEIWDYDFSKAGEDARSSLLETLSDIPEYACVVFVFDTAEFKLDARYQINARLKALFSQVEFCPQDQDKLTRWIAGHVKSAGKKIAGDTAEYLSFRTGGLMTTLDNEIAKLVSYCGGDTVTRADVDAVVTPVLDAAAYELTDAMLRGDCSAAAGKLGELLAMDEAPHKILYSIGVKARQLLGAKLCLEAGAGTGEFSRLFGIRYEFQARAVLSAARRASLGTCRGFVCLCAEAAYKLNSSAEGGGREILAELLTSFALLGKAG